MKRQDSFLFLAMNIVPPRDEVKEYNLLLILVFLKANCQMHSFVY